MRKSALIILSLTILTSLTFVISSCKEDEPPAKPVVSFKTDKLSVSEGNGTLEVEVELSSPAPSDLTIEYNLAGTAVDLEAAPNVASSDYSIEGGSGELEIEAGATSGSITILLLADNGYEDNETIEIELDDAGSNATVSDENSAIEITIVNDDDKAIANITTASFAINEDDAINSSTNELAVFEVEVTLDKPAASAVTVNYELSGTAIDTVFVSENQLPFYLSDYFIDGSYGQVTIAAGQSTGKIKLQVIPDYRFEPVPEQIIITLIEGGSSAVSVGQDNEMTITISQQNGKVISLSWDDPAYTDVDMDMFLWIGNDVNDTESMELFTLSALGRTTPKQEVIFIPDAIFVPGADVAFGASYVYYDGTPSSLNFDVTFSDYVDGVLEDEATADKFSATYTAANINKWDTQTGSVPAIEQTFTMSDGVYANFSTITVPTAGSRVKQKTLLRSTFGEKYFLKPGARLKGK
jgi:hypothetical protein